MFIQNNVGLFPLNVVGTVAHSKPFSLHLDNGVPTLMVSKPVAALQLLTSQVPSCFLRLLVIFIFIHILQHIDWM